MTTEAALAFRQEALFQMIIEAVEKDASEDLPGSVQQGDSAVHDCCVFEVLRHFILTPHLLEERSQVIHELGTSVLVDLSRDCVRSGCFPAGELLYGPDGFLEGWRKVEVHVGLHLRQTLDGGVGDDGGAVEDASEMLGPSLYDLRLLSQESAAVGTEERSSALRRRTVDSFDRGEEVLPFVAVRIALDLLSYSRSQACGTFTDISASSFLEVQLNLSYRRQWDPHVSLLETMRPRSGSQDGADQTEIIRWVSKFPFPMARREYVYARRWWAEMHSSCVAKTESKSNAGCFSSGLALIVSRAVTQPSEVQKHDSPSQPVERSWYSASVAGPNVVSVSSYESNMLIRSHSRFDEAGLDYFLTYSDDPKLSVSRETVSWLQNMIIPRLLEQLHTAAQRITSSGLPPGITPVFLHLTAPASPDRGASEDEPSTPPVVRSETDRQQPTEDPSTSETVHVLPSAGLFAEVTQDNSYQLFVS
nr:unnamed protein product [Spirometra erinaceieuropaei]